MNENKLEIKKIFLKGFIETLMEIHANGVDYINMVVEKGKEQDSISFIGLNPKDQDDKEDGEEVINFEKLI